MSDYQSNQIKLINTSLIDPHPDNPRKNIGDVSDLAASIKANASPRANRPAPAPCPASCSTSTRSNSSKP